MLNWLLLDCWFMHWCSVWKVPKPNWHTAFSFQAPRSAQLDVQRHGAHTPSSPVSPMSPRSPLPIHSPYGSPRASPLPSRRSPSPRRADVGFASAVSNIVDQAHHIAEQDRRKHHGECYFCTYSGAWKQHESYLISNQKLACLTTPCL